LLKPVIHEALFVSVSTNGPEGNQGIALAEKWSFILTKHDKQKSTSSFRLSEHSGSHMKGIAIDENYFQPEPSSV
jgi:hypothetical protein